MASDNPTITKVHQLEEKLNAVLETTLSTIQQPAELHGELKSFQLRGYRWLVAHEQLGVNCILGKFHFISKLIFIEADEMGCGKTIQAIAYLLHLSSLATKPILILAPLTIISNWSRELDRFAPSLKVHVYLGNKQERESLRHDYKTLHTSSDIVLSSFDICNIDFEEFFVKVHWQLLLVDEAQRLKNKNCLLYQNLEGLKSQRKLLLTGTPIQNNFDELYALLHFLDPLTFHHEECKDFTSAMSVHGDQDVISLAKLLIRPYMLRRLKEQVVSELPEMKQVLLYVGLTAVQKSLYISILRRQIQRMGKIISLSNILIQLRKVVDHPYLFPGVEQEPFEMGEHLVESSAKLIVLDKLLEFLHRRNGHKVLIFSQMTSMLDILQDYLDYRGYSYDRLDGSVRGDDRDRNVVHFAESESFIFLLSTRAGGVGLNLTVADVAVFYDSDFNPQVDLQAAARIHRIGQTKKVTLMIRLVARGTVEELILSRANFKKRFSKSILDSVVDDLNDDSDSHGSSHEDILKFGLDSLMNSENENTLINENFDFDSLFEDKDQEQKENEENGNEMVTNMYVFGGKDYKMILNMEENDNIAFGKLKQVPEDEEEDSFIHGRKRKKISTVSLEEEYERLENERKLVKLQREAERERKKMDRWKKNGYSSLNLPLEHLHATTANEDTQTIDHVKGSIVHPFVDNNNGNGIIICWCADNSGSWPDRGIFQAVSSTLSSEPARPYVRAHENKDLHLGDALLFKLPLEPSRNVEISVCLLIAQKRLRTGSVSDIIPEHLETSLNRLSAYAMKQNMEIHLPYLGSRDTGSRYSAERLISKCLSQLGVKVRMYYYNRSRGQQKKNFKEFVQVELFEDMIASIYPIVDEEGKEFAKMLRRYICAFGGSVEQELTSHVNTIILLDDNQQIREDLADYHCQLIYPKEIVEKIKSFISLEDPNNKN